MDPGTRQTERCVGYRPYGRGCEEKILCPYRESNNIRPAPNQSFGRLRIPAQNKYIIMDFKKEVSKNTVAALSVLK
jgi:hypothetical protein